MRIVIKAGDVVEGEPKQICIPGRGPIAIYKVGDEYFATDDTCTHGDASLAEGLQEGYVIECPFHAGTFDIRTGEAIGYPVTEDVAAHSVSVVGEELIIELGVSKGVTT